MQLACMDHGLLYEIFPFPAPLLNKIFKKKKKNEDFNQKKFKNYKKSK